MGVSILDKENRTNELITIKDLFAEDHYYRIPDYQRGYSWGSDKEFLELWKDILRLYHSNNVNRKHYTGMITLDEIKTEIDIDKENLYDTNSFYIVDGQQRITSIIIILKTILDYAKENEIEPITSNDDYKLLLSGDSGIRRFGYSTKRQDGADEFFRKRIYEGNKNLPMPNQYFININDSQVRVEKELNRYDDEKIKDIIDIILNRLVFNIYFITEDFDVRVTFETMNNRGKSLTSLELLKNRLMYLSTFFSKDANNYGGRLQTQIDLAWKNIYDHLNYKDSRLSDDEYLKAHWIVYQGLNKKKGDAFIEDILNKHFSTDSGKFYDLCQEFEYDKAFNMLLKYVKSLDEYSLYWASVNAPDNIPFDIDNDEHEWIKRISRLPDKLYMKSAVMVVLASEKISKADKIEFYSKLEKFVFINILLAQDKNDLSFLVTGAKDLMNEVNDPKEKMDALIKSLETHALALNSERAKKAIRIFKEYIDGKENYYYNWNGISYFLYEYNDSLAIPNAAKIEWYKLNNTSIEHVLPQTPEREYWKTSFNEYIGTDSAKKIINSLGNLLLLSSGAENSSLKNYSYPVKREMDVDTRKFAYSDGSRSARKIAQEEYWTPKQVYDRSVELLKFMHSHWLVNYITTSEWNEIVTSLNLINFEYRTLTEDDYSNLLSKLDSIDVSQEREQANINSIREKQEDYYSKQLLEYFDKDVFYLVPNSRQVRYVDWKYSFVITKDKEKKPLQLRIGVKINSEDHSIVYKFRDNTISVRYWIDHIETFYKSVQDLPDELRMFLRSLFRYIRKARQRNNPQFVAA
ncbi:MAG TPA: DUF262 domain-containing protein [Bacilli bacterium]|nr:DUF262 domain-containing protein [Bacilli bacterium]